MAARDQVRRPATRALKAHHPQSVFSENEKENVNVQNSSASVRSKAKMASCQPQAQKQPRRRTVLGEISNNAVFASKPAKENVKQCTRNRKTDVNYNLRSQTMEEPRRALGEITNVVVNKPPQKPVPKKVVPADFIIRRREGVNRFNLAVPVRNQEKRLKPVKPVPRRSDKEVLTNSVLRQPELTATSSVASVLQNATPLTVKLNELCLTQTQRKDGAGQENSFSTYRYATAEIASLPYAPDFLRIPEYLEEIHEYLIKREQKLFREVDFLQNSSVNPRWRAILVDWLVSVSVHFNWNDETLHVAILLLDSLLKVNNSLTRRILQLVGVTCLFIASKFEEKFPGRSKELVETTDGSYSVENILAMEQFILATVQFNVPLPSSLMFYRRGFKIVVFHHAGVYPYKDLYFIGSFILDLAMVDYEACAHSPSNLGLACLALSMMINQLDVPIVHMWSKIQHHVRWSIQELKPALISLCNILERSYSEPRQLVNVMKKFALPKYNSVSMLPQMNPRRWYQSVSLQIQQIKNV